MDADELSKLDPRKWIKVGTGQSCRELVFDARRENWREKVLVVLRLAKATKKTPNWTRRGTRSSSCRRIQSLDSIVHVKRDEAIAPVKFQPCPSVYTQFDSLLPLQPRPYTALERLQKQTNTEPEAPLVLSSTTDSPPLSP